MIPETSKKKLYLGLLIIGVIFGVLFLIWAFLLNRATIKITAKAPYFITIKNLKTVPCSEDECKSIIAPGEYTIIIQKNGYKDEQRNIKLPLRGVDEEKISLNFIPVLTDGVKIEKSNSKPSPLSAQAGKIFYDQTGQYAAFLKRNEGNFLQTLYLQNLDQNNEVQAAVPVTSFIRDLNNYVIRISPDRQKIIVIDQQNDNSNLYLVDLKIKSRQNLLKYPVIRDAKWLPNNQDFLFQARAEKSLSEGLFLYANNKVLALNLKTNLNDVAIVDNEKLIAATIQQIPGSSNLSEIEGTGVALGENFDNLILSTGTVKDTKRFIYFVDFSLKTNEAILIKGTPGTKLPDEVKLNAAGNTLLIINGDEQTSLQFSE